MTMATTHEFDDGVLCDLYMKTEYPVLYKSHLYNQEFAAAEESCNRLENMTDETIVGWLQKWLILGDIAIVHGDLIAVTLPIKKTCYTCGTENVSVPGQKMYWIYHRVLGLLKLMKGIGNELIIPSFFRVGEGANRFDARHWGFENRERPLVMLNAEFAQKVEEALVLTVRTIPRKTGRVMLKGVVRSFEMYPNRNGTYPSAAECLWTVGDLDIVAYNHNRNITA